MTSIINPPQPQQGPAAATPPPVQPPTGASPDHPRGGPRSVRDIPLRTLAVDVAGLGGLGALALFGFRNAYGGTRYFLAGVVGLVVGMAIAWFGARRRLGVLPTALLTVIGYLVVGGVVVAPNETIAGFVPTPGSIQAMADGAVAGWARLLTSLPPVGEADNLLAVPFLSGLLCGLLALTVSLRSRKPLFALVFPTIVLALGILFGIQEPASLLLQGAVFAVVAIAWASYRYQTRRRIDTGRRRSTRWIGVVAMLGLAAVLATQFGESIPGADRPRVVLRDDIDPPFDPSDYPSPLVGYRSFTNGPPDGTKEDPEDARQKSVGWRHTELFEVRGMPEDEPLRLATLDTYDGTVYEVGSGSGSSGYFQRVGESVTPDLAGAEGEERTVEIEVLEGRQVGAGEEAERPLDPYADIWLPLPAHPTSIDFDGDDAKRTEELASSLRLNVSTGAAAVPVRLAAGDRYTVSFMDVDQPDLSELKDPELAKISLPKPYPATHVQSGAGRYAQGDIGRECDRARAAEGAASTADPGQAAGDPAGADEAGTDKVAAAESGTAESVLNPVKATAMIGTNLQRCGGLDDGRQGQGSHTAARLNKMMPNAGGAMVGNGEQYAPLAALMADAIGVDARVVMGFRPRKVSDDWREAHPEPGLQPSSEGVYRVAGNDIDAWIEINVEGHGWVPVYVTPDKPEPVVLPQPKATAPQNEPPPPPPSIPPSDEEEVDTDKTKTKDPCELDPDQPQCKDDKGFAIPGWIIKTGIGLLIPITVVTLITGIIAWLKARRRTHRRFDGPPDARVSGGWEEITDLACDLGSPVPARVTRREAAGLIGNNEATHLARHADGAVFGPYDLADADVEHYWNEVDAVRTSMVSDLSRFGRWKVLVSLSSLRLNAQRKRAMKRAARTKGAVGASQQKGPRRDGPPSGSAPQPGSSSIAPKSPIGPPLWSPDVAGGNLR